MIPLNMGVRRALVHAVGGLFLAGSLLAQPTIAAAAAQARGASKAAPSSAAGSELTIYLMTMGQGDQIWEKFGHNAIGVRDEHAGTDIVYNWGMFSFEQPGFVPRFLRGLMLYWMAPFDASQIVLSYIGANRSVTVQELDLDPAARIAMRDFLAWNARDENKFYRYEYFRDNCSTRTRDAIDRATGGALSQQLKAITTPLSYRDNALRLTQDDLLISTGIDIGLGLNTDRHLSAWEEAFIPMSLKERIRAVRIRHADGQEVPLVRTERTVFQSTRRPEAAAPSNRAPWFFLFSAGLGLVFVILAMRAARGLRWARVLTLGWCVVWSVTVGLLGTLLLLLWTATEHEAAYRNMNLFHLQPLWLAVGIAAFFAARRAVDGRLGAAASLVRIGAVVGGVLSLLGFVVLALPALRQGYGAPVALAAPLNLATAFALLRLFPRLATSSAK